MSNRNPMLAKIHIAAKALGLDDATYRQILERLTGKSSSRDLKDHQLAAVLAEFQRLGWTPPKGSGGAATSRKASGKAHVRKVFAIWSDMCKGGIPETPTRAALLAFVKRMTGLDDPEWMTVTQANTVTEALKAWRKRAEAAR